MKFNDEHWAKKARVATDEHAVLSILKAALVNSEGRLELADLEVPKIGKTEILVKMRACGVCGTDLEKLQGVRVTPPVLGHEVVGDIEEVGSEVTSYSRGDRVAVHHHVPCGNCFYCRAGDQTMCPDFPKSNLDPCGFAEYFRVPEINVSKGAVFHIPVSMDFEEAAFEFGVINECNLETCVTVANAVGALIATKRGAITALPTRAELENFLKQRGVVLPQLRA